MSAIETYHEFETYTQERRLDLINKRLSELVQHAKDNVTYYKNRGDLESYEALSSNPLNQIKFMGPKDMRAYLPPVGKDILSSVSSHNSKITILQSGGTTGIPKTSPVTWKEMEYINELNARGFFACGLEKEDSVANLWAVGCLYATFIHMNRFFMEYGCTNYPLSNVTPSKFVYELVKNFKINCLSGISSTVLKVLRDLHLFSLEEKVHLPLSKVYFGGEHLYEADRLELKKTFDIQTILAPGYGSVDTWYIGYQCSHCPPGVFHGHDDHCYIEIIKEDTLEHAKLGEVGLITVTPLMRYLVPLLRYKVGDKAKWLRTIDGKGDLCPCGRTTSRFQLLGRGDDVLRIGFDSIEYSQIQNALLDLNELSGSIQMEKKRIEGRDLLIVRVESNRPLTPSEIENHVGLISENILRNKPSLDSFIQKGTVWPLKVEILPLNTLSRNPKTGKLTRVIDCI